MSSSGEPTTPPFGLGQERARRARTILLTGLAVFAGLQLVTAFASQVGPQRDPIYSERLARLTRGVRVGAERPFTVAMLGSSRTQCGFRATALNEPLALALQRPVAVANFGLPGCGPIRHLVTWNRLCHDGRRPDLVLIEILPAKFDVKCSTAEVMEPCLSLSRLRLCDLPVMRRYFNDVRPGLKRDWWLAWPNALYTQRLDLVYRIAPGLLPFEHRLGRNDLPEDQPIPAEELPAEHCRLALQHARREYAESLQDFHVGGRNCVCLRELLACIRRDGSRPVLVVMPEGPLFRSWYAPGSYEQFRGWLEELRAELGVEIVDAHEWMDEKDFSDSHHLSPRGAAKFTKRLGDEFLVPALRNLSQTAPANIR
jgi:hypothetical protein